MKERIENYVSNWERKCYQEGIPDEAPTRLEQLNKVPSYRMIVGCILKNDVTLKGLGCSRPKSKAYNTIKKIELKKRGVITQTELL